MMAKMMNGIVMIMMMLQMYLSVLVAKLPTCGSNSNPEKYEDCKDSGDATNYCCFAQSPGYNATIRQCVKVEKTKYHGQREKGIEAGQITLAPGIPPVSLGDNYYRLDCGDIEFSKEKGYLCGNDFVPNMADCWTFSTESRSCCATPDLTDPEKKKIRCIWYKKVQGNETNDDNLNLNCSSTSLKATLFSLVTLFLMFIQL